MKEKTAFRLEKRNWISNTIKQNEHVQIDLINRAITMLHDLNITVIHYYSKDESSKTAFKTNISLQVVQTLFKKCISQIESVLILLENGKYLEAYSILRDLFETAVFLLYTVNHPFEAKRWLNWAEMDFENNEKYKNENKKFDDFKLFLERNNHKELLSCINKRNFSNYRNFSSWFIREQAFKSTSSIKGSDFKESYFELCKFVHPSINSLNHNDKLSDSHFNSILADILFITKQIADIFIDHFKDALLGQVVVQEFLNTEKEIDEFNRTTVPQPIKSI